MTAPPAPNPADVQRRRAFVRTHVEDARRRGTVPTFGTADWHRLPYADPRRWASVLVAAECWAIDGDDIPGRLRREITDLNTVDTRRDDEAFADMAARVRSLARTPSHAELVERRAETA